MSEQLTDQEAELFNSGLNFLADHTKDATQKAIAVGQVLAKIQELKLYREEYRDFKLFLKERAGIEKDKGFRYIGAFKTLTALQNHLNDNAINPTKYSSISSAVRLICNTKKLRQFFSQEATDMFASEFPQLEIPTPQNIAQFKIFRQTVEPEQAGQAWLFVLDKALEAQVSEIKTDFLKKALAEFKGEKPALDMEQEIDMSGIPPLKAYKSHFVQFPNDLFDHGLIRILGPNTIAVYQVIIRIGAANINKGNPHCECSHEQIEELTGLGHTTISKSVGLLEKVGLVVVERGVKQRNKYQLLDPSAVIERHKWDRVFGKDKENTEQPPKEAAPVTDISERKPYIPKDFKDRNNPAPENAWTSQDWEDWARKHNERNAGGGH